MISGEFCAGKVHHKMMTRDFKKKMVPNIHQGYKFYLIFIGTIIISEKTKNNVNDRMQILNKQEL